MAAGISSMANVINITYQCESLGSACCVTVRLLLSEKSLLHAFANSNIVLFSFAI